MTSTDGQLSGASGHAALAVSVIQGLSTTTTAWACSPLRILTPRARGASVWAYTSSFGGGMVAGDCTRLDVRIDAGASCFLGTQASTKVYRNPAHLPCSHELRAHVADRALLILAPDPVQCFAESSYEQTQRFTLNASGNLLLVDWMSAGRAARGERWNFRRYLSRNIVERDGRPLLLDALRLDVADGTLASQFRSGRFHCFATVVLFGPQLAPQARAILDSAALQPIEPRADLICAASPLHEGAVLRWAGTSVEQVGRAMHERIRFVGELLNDDPFARKW